MLFPNVETRHCVRHLHSNFKKVGFLTKKLKDLLWKAVRASTPRDFEDVMAELKNTNQHAYDWLKEKNPTHWSRSHFSIRSQSDMVVNNFSECFNKVILKARGKSILTMMETIKTKIMYQVECDPSGQHVVDLVENSCSCRNWDLIGTPCIHGVGVIHLKDDLPFTPTSSMPNMLSILPPTLRKSPDRPTKVRRKESDEPQEIERLTKRGVEMRCSKCNKKGHNKRSCKEEVKRHKFGVHNQVVAPNQQETTPTQKEVAPTHQKDVAPRGNLPFKRKPTTFRWIPSTQESSMTN
ncbi:hypothetical protein GOBAR_DD22269 [Gossypium barbadense]|nr:hypothetical protein GOBAR_DD22269 [Gossypium barbadense]